MAIQPIDMQTLFTQLDKVGKIQASQKEGLAIQQALQGIEVQKKVEAQIQSVNETPDTGEGSKGVQDRSPQQQADEDGSGEKDGRGKPDKTQSAEALIIRDPTLGKNVDLHG
ncbi:MAG: hypothetical protein LBD74_00450 [Spirochaetaceae bacterium]|jgi:hypothetical protein|nr:hypothetical protein [Spirochaetaceae bacterium]